MKNFLYGILFISILCPLINGIIALYNQLIEYLCMCLAVKTAKKQQEAGIGEEEVQTQAIGFQMPYVEEEYYDEEEE